MVIFYAKLGNESSNVKHFKNQQPKYECCKEFNRHLFFNCFVHSFIIFNKVSLISDLSTTIGLAIEFCASSIALSLSILRTPR